MALLANEREYGARVQPQLPSAKPDELTVEPRVGRHVVVPSSEYLRNLALDKITVRPEVQQLETSLIFEHQRDHVFPTFVDLGDRGSLG